MGRLDGKVAIITGGGAGMGEAASVLFAREGAKVAVADWDAQGGERVVTKIKETGGAAIFIKADVSKADDVRKMIKATVDTYGKLDILYNNAGIATYKPLIDLTDEDFDKMISINLKGVWLGMKYAIPEMIKTGGGSIINAASIAADAGQRGSAIYAASKGGVVSMSRVAAVEYATNNIRVNVIKPGAIATPMFMNAQTDPGVVERIVRETPQRRLGKAEEVAYVALFLASDESSYITGQKIAIDGGIEADSHIL